MYSAGFMSYIISYEKEEEKTQEQNYSTKPHFEGFMNTINSVILKTKRYKFKN